MNNKEFIAELSRRMGYTQDNTQSLVRNVIDAMATTFDEGENVFIPNFGTFEVKKRLERIMVNPSTRQNIIVPPKLLLNFKPVAAIKEEIKKGEFTDE